MNYLGYCRFTAIINGQKHDIRNIKKDNIIKDKKIIILEIK